MTTALRRSALTALVRIESSMAVRASLVLGLLALFASAPSGRAESRFYTSAAARPATVECVLSAAALQGIPGPIIIGFLKTEGGHPGQESRNTDGSFDLGPMQVNDRAWLAQIARMHFHGDLAGARDAVRDDGCYNIHIGTWIFKQALVEAGGDWRRAVGYYNSHNPVHSERYIRRYAENLAMVLRVINITGR